MIQQRVIRFIEKEHLFLPDDKLLVALSGGADSVALLRVLHTAGYQCEAAHCNFHLRGEESNRDERFVRQLCQKYGIRLHITDFNTTQYATEKRISIEMAARELRYNWFEKIKEECGAHVIAVAHHQDDSVETMLFNLIRGTGNRTSAALHQPGRNHPLPATDRTRLRNRQHQSGRRIYP